MASGTHKIWLDTDIGSDIDDAVCLAYLLANPACELLGSTTVSGESELRARMASALCRVAGQDVPIYPGREKALLPGRFEQLRAQQAEKLGAWAHETEFPRGEAVEHMRRTIRAHPGEVTLLTIGPLTNVAALFAADPETAGMLRSLVMMCGIFTNGLAYIGPREWNAMLDRTATAMVYAQDVAVHRSIGLDVTCKVLMPADEVRERFDTPLLRPVRDFAQVWFDSGAQHIIFHDPLAATTIFDDAICTFTRGEVTVELESRKLAGMTHWKAREDGPHEVALSVDPARFFDHYFSFFD